MPGLNFRPAEPCGLSKDSIHQIAETFADRLGYTPGDDLAPVVAALGGRIINVPLSDLTNSKDGSIKIFGFRDFEIYLPEDGGPFRSRFTVAHELGHYFLHYPIVNEPMQAARYGTGRVEWEANWFAAGFLMKSRDFTEALERHDNNLARVASEFRVSLEAAEYQAIYLGVDT